jgi:hypothetical protein
MDKAMRVFLVIPFLMVFVSNLSSTEYRDHELFVVRWGSAPDQLKILEPTINGAGEPDEDIDPGSGPSMGYIDIDNFCYLSSSGFRQLKVFDDQGNLMADPLKDQTQLDSCLIGYTIDHFIVDSLSHIYIAAFPGLPFVPITDIYGQIIDTLFPFGHSSENRITGIRLTPTGVMIFDEETKNMISFNHGDFMAGGSFGLLSSNGSYYSVIPLDLHTLRFNKYENPDSNGKAETRDYTEMSFPNDSISDAYVLNGGPGNELFLFIQKTDNNYNTFEIWNFDLEYNLIARARFPVTDNIYKRTMEPFVSHDGTIYEFRCLDDGLHVVKWTKQ